MKWVTPLESTKVKMRVWAPAAEALHRVASATARAPRPDDRERTFRAVVRIDTPVEVDYYRHGGILQYVVRQILGSR